MGNPPSGWVAPPYLSVIQGVCNTVKSDSPATVTGGGFMQTICYRPVSVEWWGYFHFNTPITTQISALVLNSALVANATPTANCSESFSVYTVIELVTTDWNPATINWNNKPAGAGALATVGYAQMQCAAPSVFNAGQTYQFGEAINVERGIGPAVVPATTYGVVLKSVVNLQFGSAMTLLWGNGIYGADNDANNVVIGY